MPGALDGIRIIDVTTVLLGPYGTQMLGDLGAEVIRIDPPGGPRWTSPAAAMLNRGQRCVELDLWEWGAGGDPTDGNWGLEMIRAPQMWALDDYVQRRRAATAVCAAVIEPGTPVVFVAPWDDHRERCIANVREVQDLVLGSDPIFKDMINDPVFKDMMGVTGAGSGADKGWFGPLPPGLTPEEKKEFHDLEAGLATEVRGAMASEEYGVVEEAWARKSHPKRLSPALQNTQTVGKAGGAKRYGDHKTLRLGVAGGGRVNLKR